MGKMGRELQTYSYTVSPGGVVCNMGTILAESVDLKSSCHWGKVVQRYMSTVSSKNVNLYIENF